jgi:hypothetical protein
MEDLQALHEGLLPFNFSMVVDARVANAPPSKRLGAVQHALYKFQRTLRSNCEDGELWRSPDINDNICMLLRFLVDEIASIKADLQESEDIARIATGVGRDRLVPRTRWKRFLARVGLGEEE